jgi:hypothetical protein
MSSVASRRKKSLNPGNILEPQRGSMIIHNRGLILVVRTHHMTATVVWQWRDSEAQSKQKGSAKPPLCSAPDGEPIRANVDSLPSGTQ